MDWQYLRRMTSPVSEVVEAIHARCVEMDLANIMAFQCDWNEEVVAQFYATLWVDTINHVMHWTLEGKRYAVSIVAFARLFGFNIGDENGSYVKDESKIDLHVGSELEDTKMHFMYDGAYIDSGKPVFWKEHWTHTLLQVSKPVVQRHHCS